MVDGVALKLATLAGGGATGLTSTLTDCGAPVPPGPVQMSEYT
jgi:hypothetical protein